MEIPIASQSLLIQFPSTKVVQTYFKPQLPYFGQILVHKPDFTPAVGEEIKLCYEARKQSWVSEGHVECSTLQVNQEGIVEYQIPPQTKEVQQILVKAEPSGQPVQSISFALRPWHTQSSANLVLRHPRMSSCAESSAVEVLISDRSYAPSHVYYQVIGRGKVEAPKKVAVSFEDYDFSREPFLGEAVVGNNKNGIAQIRIEMPQDIALSPMTRVVVYYQDQEKNIVAASTTYTVDCLSREIDLKLKHVSNDKINVELEAKTGSRCAFDLSSNNNRMEATKNKILKLMERFDINHEYVLKDKCELQRIQSQRSTEEQTQVPSYAEKYAYREVALSPFRPAAVDYSDSWDVFNDVGLTASSNRELDQSPCESEVYPDGVPSQVLQGMEAERPQLAKTLPKDDTDARSLIKLEESLARDLLYWNAAIERSSFQKTIQLRDDQKDQEEFHASALCFHPQNGMRWSSQKIQNRNQQYNLKTDVSEQATVGESVPVTVYVNKTTNGCLPVSIIVIYPLLPNYSFIVVETDHHYLKKM